MSKEGFTSRWSRMKQEERIEKNLPATEVEPDVSQQQDDLNQLSDADMPALETLSESSDYSGFLSAKVSEAVRKAALRKMFHLPAFNVVDGLDDYAEDYTNFEALGDIVTHDMKRMAKLDEEREKQKRLQAEADLKEKQAKVDASEDAAMDSEEQSALHESAVESELDDETVFDDLEIGDADIEDA